MTARFILSLDCEGKWGVADHLGRNEHRWLTDSRLHRAYRGILSLLDSYDLPATFAFVGLFAESARGFTNLREEVEDLALESPYVAAAIDDLRAGSREGWHGDWAVESVLNARAGHEIALHGVTHAPWSEVDREFLIREMQLLRRLSIPIRSAETFVFPRNEVAHVDLLTDAKIRGYRTARPHRNRLAALVSEFNILDEPEGDPLYFGSGPLPIPAGYFVNWQRGLRSLVPKAISTLRLRKLLDRAERSGEVVHFWLHPENVASAPSTLRLLDRILRVVVRRRDEGRCTVQTQVEYVNQRQLESRGAMTSASPTTTVVPS